MRYSIISNLKNLSINWEKYVFDWKKTNFETIANYVRTAKLLLLGRALNIYFDYFMFYPSRQHVK